jgi:NADPH-dependent curcumin reductase CurA
MARPTSTKVYIVRNRPTKEVALTGPDATWSIEERPLPNLQEGQILAEAVYFSNDPAQRTWMDATMDPVRLYVPPILAGDAMRANGVMRVLDSRSASFTKDDMVYGSCSWARYHVLDAAGLQICKPDSGITPTQYLGPLGFAGASAYVGLVDVGETKAGDTVVVNGAAGSVGNMVVQIAKHMLGCKNVVGLAGSDEKCRWVESLGADKCINYKGEWKEELVAATPGGVNVFFDNVGGEQLDFLLSRLVMHGKVVVCGSIAEYNGEKHAMQHWFNVTSFRLQLKGFILYDYMYKYAQIIGELTDAVQAGKIRVDDTEMIVDTKFEDIPKTWMMLWKGGNRGKLMTRLL